MTTTALKVFALIAMFIDHTAQFIPNMPEFFGWIGRIAAPIFLFCVAIGYKHTTDKKKYLFRLYVAGVLMASINLFLNNVYSYTGADIRNNFFSTLFMVGCTLFLLENKKVKYWVYFFLWQIFSTFLCVVFSEIVGDSPTFLYPFYGSIFGNLIFVEGGIFFVLIGGIIFLTKNKWQLIISYTLFCFFLFEGTRRWGGNPGPVATTFFPFADYQWIMIAALPFMLLYNGKKGIGLKYFFYFFYPIHIIVLYLIGIRLLNQ
jgi:TraX protein